MTLPTDTLLDMLTTMRPMGSRQERKFRRHYLYNLPGASTDPYNNIHVIVPRADKSGSQVLWSSHTDTVHRQSGRQRLFVDGQHIRLALGEQSNCLGADDTIGVWLMREMILAQVPGHYVFHWGEERGGIGSKAVTRQQPERFGSIKYAIAFDRRGKRDIITHQGYGRCCSDAFAWSLADILGGVAKYKPCEWGIYTDTAEYTDIIGECTNVSVGYKDEHRATESVDYAHALRLLAVLLQFDESKLVSVRKPGEDEYAAYRQHWSNQSAGTTVIDIGANDWTYMHERPVKRQAWKGTRKQQRQSRRYEGLDGRDLNQGFDLHTRIYIADQLGCDVEDMSDADWALLDDMSEDTLRQFGITIH